MQWHFIQLFVPQSVLSFWDSFGTLWSCLLGDDIELNDMKKGNRIVAPALYYSYLFFIGIIAFSRF